MWPHSINRMGHYTFFPFEWFVLLAETVVDAFLLEPVWKLADGASARNLLPRDT